ncbi:MAG TPA: imidazolonepropionase [Bellilinea sp.]|nr:imidazolonepropionase [Bellilinea sp.]
MLITNISQLLTLAGGPQPGKTLGRLGIQAEAAVLVRGSLIEAVGPSERLLKAYPTEERYNAAGKVVMPGFVDPHTHLVWAGDRAAEFEMRLEGMSYQEIAAAGGGIRSTVRATRNASLDELKNQSRIRANMMLHFGTTTAEVKTGYALQHPGELTQLEAILELDKEGRLELVPTYLGAHDIPPEYKENPEDYTSQLCRVLLPEVLDWWQNNAHNRPLPFVDVFCETIAFNLEQSTHILQTAKELGFPLKIHADEFDNLGGAAMAARLGAASADHLIASSPVDIAAMVENGTVAVALPCTPFGLATGHYMDAKAFLEAGATLAIATDLNPGTAWCEPMQFAIALACRYMHLTPAQAIAAATINAAAAIQRADRIGSLEAGKQADLLILEVSDYRHLGYRFGGNLVAQVMKRGEFVVF